MRGDDGGGASSSSLSFASKDDALAYLHVCNVKPRSADVAGPLEAERCLLVTGVPRDVRAEAVQKCMSQLMEAASSGGKVERVVVFGFLTLKMRVCVCVCVCV